MLVCDKCGSGNPDWSRYCNSCGAVLSPAEQDIGYPIPRADTSRPLIAGIALVGCGLMDFVSGVRLMTAEAPVLEIPIDLSGLLHMCGALAFIFGAFALVGAWLSFSRRLFPFAMLAAALGMIGLGPFYIGSVLGLIGLIVIALSRDEFKD